jgi:restriction system protein
MNTPTPDILEILGDAFSLVFIFWPLIMLGALRGRGRLLPQMLVIWSFLAVGRLLLSSNPILLSSSFIIPEPYNTIGFFATGVVLWAIAIGKRILGRRSLRRAGDSARLPDDLLDLSARQFEEMVVELYRAAGHKAQRTGAIGDHGVDVVVQAKNGEKWVIQCKRWRGAVGEPVVRDLYGVLHHEKADRAVIITTGQFTESAREWARGKPIALYDGDQFLRSRRRVRGQG